MKYKNTIIFNNNLITNFKPNVLKNFNNINYFKKNNNQIFCKNFLLYLLLIKYNKKFNFFVNTSLFIKKKKNKIYTILRSPYRHKLARQQISFNRFFINLIFYINICNKINIKNFKNFKNLIKILKKFNLLFETNLISLENSKIQFNINFKNNFLIKNYF